MYLAPVVYACAVSGRHAIYNFFAADAYYYLTIAKNTHLGGFATFDGLTPNNGFHPLWQYLLVLISSVTGPDKVVFIWSVFILSCAIAAAGIYILALCIYERQRSLLLVLFLIPGLFHILVPETALYSLSAWRVINGMETPLSLFFLAAIVRLLSRAEQRFSETTWNYGSYLALGCSAGFLIWARLDNAALVATLPIYFYRNRADTKAVGYLLGPPVAAVLLYVALNLAAGLPALPISGSLKSAFVLPGNLKVMFATFVDSLREAPGAGLLYGWRVRSKFAAVLILGCSVSLLLSALRPTATRLSHRLRAGTRPGVFVPLGLFFLIRMAYYVSVVRLPHQGFWYYVDIAAVLTAILLLQVNTDWLSSRVLKSFVATGWLFIYLGTTHRLLDFTERTRWCPHIIDQHATLITECISSQVERPKILDSSDGVFSYFLDFPSQPGTGLTANASGYQTIKQHGFAKYYDEIIRAGYTVNTWSGTCNSGFLPRKFIASTLDCGQSRTIRLSILKSSR